MPETNYNHAKLLGHYYEQFDADTSLAVPAEGYGGWKSTEVEICVEHTALVVMHAWDRGTKEAYPGWYRHVEYLDRADQILRTVFPELLATVRKSNMKLFHVVAEGDYYQDYPGYQRCVQIAGPAPQPQEKISSDQALDKLRALKADLGKHNAVDIKRGWKNLDFAPQAKPVGAEGIAESSHQLFALCRAHSVNHLIYSGFAVNWCLLLSPGGMAEMSKYGIMCSVLRQAVTAVENKETARHELCKQIALWRVALEFGYVFDVSELINALHASSQER